MVENIDSNAAQIVRASEKSREADIDVRQGHFTEKTTVPLLTVYRVGCMPVTTAATRGGYGEQEAPEAIVPRTAVPQVPGQDAHEISKRTSFEGHALKQVLSIAERLSTGIDPTNENITVREFRLLRETNTALFAITLVNSGLPLDELCRYLRDPGIANNLDDNLVDAEQAANIVCFASVYGLYFNMTNDELLSDLAGLEYAIQMHAYDTSLQDLCKTLDYGAASFLGIDTEEIQKTICNGTGGVTTSSTHSITSSTTTDGRRPTATSLYPTSLFSSATGTAVGTSASSSSIVFGTNGPEFSSATSAAGTVAPWFNTTTSVKATTETKDVLTVTASAGGVSVVTAASEPSLFYSPPQLRRAELRRHGRGVF